MVPAFEFVKIEIDFNSNFKANLNPNWTQKLFNFVIWESSRERGRGATLNCETTLGRRHNCLNWLFQTLFFLKQFFFVQILQVD